MFPNATEEIIIEVMGSENNLYRPSFDALNVIFGPRAVVDESLSEDIARPQLQQQPQQVQQQPQQRSVQQQTQEAPLSLTVLDRLDRLYRGEVDHITDAAIRDLESDIAELSERKAFLKNQAQNAMSNRQAIHGQMLYERAKNVGYRLRETREQLMVSLFTRNNPRASELKAIDLHGIYVREARLIVTDFLSRAKAAFSGISRSVRIIVGIGRHSSTAFSPKLRPAIINLLKYQKLKFEPRVGEIIVLIE